MKSRSVNNLLIFSPTPTTSSVATRFVQPGDAICVDVWISARIHAQLVTRASQFLFKLRMISSSMSVADDFRNLNQTLDEMDQRLESCAGVTATIGESSGLSLWKKLIFDEELLDSPENTSNELLTELESLIEDSVKYLPEKSRRFIEARLDYGDKRKVFKNLYI